MLPREVSDLVTKMGEVDYRADQILDWVHKKGAVEVAEMTNLPKAFRDSLSEIAEISQLRQVKVSNSQIDDAVKFVFEVDNGRRIESVLISDGPRRTVCLSSQIGCPLDCKFCATGRMGFLGNLSSGEIIDQLLQVIRYATDQGDRVTNVVLMGMGEPLLNYEAVFKAISLISLNPLGNFDSSDSCSTISLFLIGWGVLIPATTSSPCAFIKYSP